MNAAPRICVVGSANVDLTFRTPHLPRMGETLAGRQFHFAFGGKGANQAVTAARLGARAGFIARVGSDAFGEEYLRHLRREGLDTTHVRVDPQRATGAAGILVDDAAQNCIIVAPGANAALSPHDVRDATEAIQSANLLLCQLEVPLDATLEAFRVARQAGVRTVLTPAPAVALPDELLQLADLLVPNETELEMLTGRQTQNLAEVEAAGKALQSRGASAVVVTLGERGALLLDGETTHIPSVPVQAVDPTGAGDAFTAAMAVFWGEGLPLHEAARKAAHVAALTVTRLGTQTAFPMRADVEARLVSKS